MLVVLASYPKSGNTWLRRFLCCYTKNRLVPLNEMADLSPIDSSSQLWEAILGYKKRLDAPEESFKLRSQFYEKLSAKTSSKILFLKSHSANATVEGCEQFSIPHVGKIIHIVRNPIDVLPSFAHHLGVSIEDAWLKMKEEKMALDEGGASQHMEMLSSWYNHTLSWLALHDNDKYLIVRYEEMKLKPITAFQKIVRHVGLELDENVLVSAINWSKFEVMAKEEESTGFIEAPKKQGHRFFRAGQVGQGSREVPEHIVEEIKGLYGELLNKLGYYPEWVKGAA